MKKQWENPSLMGLGVENTKTEAYDNTVCVVCEKNATSNAGCGFGNHYAPVERPLPQGPGQS